MKIKKTDNDDLERKLDYWTWRKTPGGEEVNIPVSFDVMQSALIRYLIEFKLIGVKVTPIEITAVYYAYKLADAEDSWGLGNLGELRLSKLNEKTTILILIDPLYPSRDELGKREADRRVLRTRNEKAKRELYQIIGKPPQWKKAIPYLFKTKEEQYAAQIAFREERIDKQRRFVSDYISLMEQDGIIQYVPTELSKMRAQNQATPLGKKKKRLDPFKQEEEAAKKQVVAKAIEMKTKEPEMTFKQIAQKLGKPERTLRHYRNKYK